MNTLLEINILYIRKIRIKLSLSSNGIRIKVFDKSNTLVNKFPTMISVAKH